MTTPTPTPTPPAVPLETFVRWLSDLRVDLAESVGGVMLRGARVVQIGASEGATARPAIGAGALVGYSMHSTAGAVVHLRDGDDAAGALVAVVELAAGESASAWFGPGGLNLSRGLFVDVAAGDVVDEGAVYLRGAD